MSIEVEGELDFGDVPAFTPETTPAERQEIWLKITDMTEEEFDAMFAENKARQANVPELGSEAPDFELDILDRVAGRLDEKIKLSSMRRASLLMSAVKVRLNLSLMILKQQLKSKPAYNLVT